MIWLEKPSDAAVFLFAGSYCSTHCFANSSRRPGRAIKSRAEWNRRRLFRERGNGPDLAAAVRVSRPTAVDPLGLFRGSSVFRRARRFFA
jgi:hypothetical protein